MSRDRLQLREFEEQHSEEERKSEAVREQHKSAEAKAKEIETQIVELQQNVKELKKQLDGERNEFGRKQAVLSSAETEYEQQLRRRGELVQASRLEQIALPFVGANDDGEGDGGDQQEDIEREIDYSSLEIETENDVEYKRMSGKSICRHLQWSWKEPFPT